MADMVSKKDLLRCGLIHEICSRSGHFDAESSRESDRDGFRRDIEAISENFRQPFVAENGELCSDNAKRTTGNKWKVNTEELSS